MIDISTEIPEMYQKVAYFVPWEASITGVNHFEKHLTKVRLCLVEFRNRQGFTMGEPAIKNQEKPRNFKKMKNSYTYSPSLEDFSTLQ